MSIIREGLSNSIAYHFIEIKDPLERFKRIAAHYSALNSDKRNTTPVLAANFFEQNEICRFIRNHLKRQGVLGAVEKSYCVYLPKYLSDNAKSSAISYQRGWYLRFNEADPKRNIQKYDYWEICFIDKDKNILQLLDGKGRATQWLLGLSDNKNLRKIEIFTCEERKISAGEMLQIQRVNINKNLRGGEFIKVNEVHNKGLKVQTKTEENIRFDCKRLQDFHFDYSYVITPSSIPLIDVNIRIAHQDSKSTNINQYQFYTILSQAKEDVWFYTDDKQALLAQLNKTIFE